MRSKTKRIFDICCAGLGLLVLSPFFLVIAVLIELDDGGPVFFKQVRVGYKGKHFCIWKFRTMVLHAEKKGSQLTVANDDRITHIGHFLRKHKLDELPQLINIFCGEMSLVGPRPEVPSFVNLYTPEQLKVLSLVPGITDPASICFRNENDILAGAKDPHQRYINSVMPKKINLNLKYAKKATFWSDLAIIFKTISHILPDNQNSKKRCTP